MTHSVGVAFSAGVGLISLVLAVVAVRAYRRTGNRSLFFVAGAFGVFTLKGVLIVSSWNQWEVRLMSGTALEIANSALDFLVVLLLVIPLLLRR